MTTLVLERLTEKHRAMMQQVCQLEKDAKKLLGDNWYWLDRGYSYYAKHTSIDQELTLAVEKCRRLVIAIEEVGEIMLPQAEEEKSKR